MYTEEQKAKNCHDHVSKDQIGKYVPTDVKTDSTATTNETI